MIANTPFLIDTLASVMTDGAKAVNKKKLVWALGAKQDRPAVWSRLLDVWEKDMDNSRDTLRGYESGQMLVLSVHYDAKQKSPLEPVTDWE